MTTSSSGKTEDLIYLRFWIESTCCSTISALRPPKSTNFNHICPLADKDTTSPVSWGRCRVDQPRSKAYRPAAVGRCKSPINIRGEPAASARRMSRSHRSLHDDRPVSVNHRPSGIDRWPTKLALSEGLSRRLS